MRAVRGLFSQMAYVRQAESESRCMVLRPQAPLPIGHTSHDAQQMKRIYDIGREMGESQIERMERFYNLPNFGKLSRLFWKAEAVIIREPCRFSPWRH